LGKMGGEAGNGLIVPSRGVGAPDRSRDGRMLSGADSHARIRGDP